MDVELSRLTDVVGSTESTKYRTFNSVKHIDRMRADITRITRWIEEKEGRLPEYFTPDYSEE